ncbi:unnamed protein product [Heligmosomoides polygyrus]|uniref:Mitochondrial glutamate carrier 1 n=1 Tax=Heligmosomoides polygyrus TaxID=6339 RepID=A0A3P8DUI0_HELPZ|nr:unnamed protein product [Heligmosomoides polygyrus]
MGGQDFSYVPKIMNGGLAGVVGVTCVFPIDLVKTRLQNQPILPNGEVQYKGILDCAKQTWRSGGVSMFSKVRALYSGAGVNILLITPEKAIKLVANDFFRYHLAVPGQKGLPAWRGMIAGGLAGMFQIIVTTPMELLKIQMQDQGRTAVAGQKKLTALELTGKLLRERGIAGLYKGLSSTFARDVTFSMMYFPLFAYLDSLGPRKSDGSGDAVFWTSFVAGLTAGAASSFTVTPLDGMIFALLTVNSKEMYVINLLFSKILQMEGPRALFKGAACRMMVMAPLFGIAQTVYYVGVAEKILGVQKATHV